MKSNTPLVSQPALLHTIVSYLFWYDPSSCVHEPYAFCIQTDCRNIKWLCALPTLQSEMVSLRHCNCSIRQYPIVSQPALLHSIVCYLFWYDPSSCVHEPYALCIPTGCRNIKLLCTLHTLQSEMVSLRHCNCSSKTDIKNRF